MMRRDRAHRVRMHFRRFADDERGPGRAPARGVLFAGHLVKHGRQSVKIPDNERSALALYDADPRKAIELAGHRLAVRADAACDLGVGGRRVKPGPLAFSWRE